MKRDHDRKADVDGRSSGGGAIDPTAVVGSDVQLGAGVSIGPFAVIGDGTVLGDGCRIGSHVVVGAACFVGAKSTLESHSVLYAGARVGERCTISNGSAVAVDGFGFAFDGAEWRKIPHVGGCELGDDVHLAPGSAVDRGSVGNTVIGNGSAIGAHVHVGHNAELGAGVRLAAHSGVAGSAVLEDDVDVGAHVAIVGHLTVGGGVRILDFGGITQSIEPGQTVAGVPARPLGEARRAERWLARLPRIVARIYEVGRAARS